MKQEIVVYPVAVILFSPLRENYSRVRTACSNPAIRKKNNPSDHHAVWSQDPLTRNYEGSKEVMLYSRG